MKFNKKGFSLAEMLIVFLLVSIMLTAFAPIMTKRTKKSSDPNCVGGIKKMEAVFPVHADNINFHVEGHIIGDAKVTLVGPGGAGGNGSYNAETGVVTMGAGGGAGAYRTFNTDIKTCNEDSECNITVTVGKGGVYDSGNSTAIDGNDTVLTVGATSYVAAGGAGAEGNLSGEGGSIDDLTVCSNVIKENCGNSGQNGNPSGQGGGNTIFSTSVLGGEPGGNCPSSNCDPHGKIGKSYERNGSSALEFFAGFGGGGGGYSGASTTSGIGGSGGDGFVKIEYSVRCE